MNPLAVADISRTPEEWEAVAIQFRADCGLVPYQIWVRLSRESKDTLGGMTQDAAKRHLVAQVARAAITKPLDAVSADLLDPGSAPTIDLGLDHPAHMAPPFPRPAGRLTLEAFKQNMLSVIELTQGVLGAASGLPPGYADAIRALPDRTLLSALPADLQTFIERELGDIEI